jgi:hypothetical protein
MHHKYLGRFFYLSKIIFEIKYIGKSQEKFRI